MCVVLDDQGGIIHLVLSFDVGEVYDRQKQIHGAVPQGQGRGNNSAGITKVEGRQCIFWNPFRQAYANEWVREPEEFIYSGEGSSGDMTETGGNADLLRHESTPSPVLVFYKIAPTGSRWRYLGEYLVIDHWYDTSPDVHGDLRRDIRFRFAAIQGKSVVLASLPAPMMKRALSPKEAEVWEALKRSPRFGEPDRLRRTAIHRDKRRSDPLKTTYAIARALEFGQACELCDQKPGWTTEQGLPHFQAHHLDPDVDVVEGIAALCGTCHDRLHYDQNRVAVTSDLSAKIIRRQRALGRPVGNENQVEGSHPSSPLTVAE
jgi:hypothetical protein